MKRELAVVFVFLLLGIPARVFAKADISKITLQGGDLKAPIAIKNPKTLATLDIWSGPGTSGWIGASPGDADRFLIDWFHGVTERPQGLQPYQLSFCAKWPTERVIYVVFYEYDPATEHGYIYLPGRTDEWYRLNVGTIFRGAEGYWFRAGSRWDMVASRLILDAKAQG